MARAIKVLYVDDEKDLLDIGKLFLEESGDFLVSIINSAPAALDLLNTEIFDAIISDYQMPHMDGIQFLIEVRKNFGKVPFILFTGRGREEIVIKALNEGADFYLQKGGEPISQFAELAHKIKQSVQRGRAILLIEDQKRREADIINFLPDPTFAIDNNGIVIAWNRAIEKMTGVNAGEILGKGNYEYSIPFYNKRRPILIDLVLNDNPDMAAYYPLLKREGQTLISEKTTDHLYNGRGATIWFTAAPLYNREGNTIGAIESIRDITDRKLNEERLRESNERLRMAQQIGQTGSWELDLATGNIWASEEAFRIFGISRSPEGIITIEDVEARIPERERVHNALINLLEKGTEYNLEYKIEPADNSSLKNVHSVARLLCNAEKKPVFIAGVIHDITSWKKAEEALADSENLFRSLVENIRDPILILSFDGKILFANPATFNLIGLKKPEISENLSIISFLDEDSYRQAVSDLEKIKRTGRPLLAEYNINPVNGERRCVEACCVRTIYKGIEADLVTLRDITDRKKAEDLVLQSEERYRQVIENANEAIVIAQGDRLVYANPKTLEMIGVTTEKLERNPFTDFIHPDDRSLVSDRYKLRISGEDIPDNYDFRLKSETGDLIWVNISSVRIEWNRRPATLNFLTNITERKRAEEQALLAKEEWERTFNALPDLISIIDTQYKIHRVNQAMADKLGLTQEQSKGLTCYQSVHNTTSPPDYCPHTLLLEDHEEHTAEVYEEKIGGHFIVTCTPLWDKDGQLSGCVHVARDLKNLKLTEEALRESEEKYRNLIENSHDIIYTITSEGVLNFVSNSWTELLGHHTEEVIGKSFQNFVHPDDTVKCWEFMKRTLETGQRQTGIEYRVQHANGTWRWHTSNSVPIKDKSGKIILFEGSAIDITERKLAEESLFQANKKLKLLSDITRHDIKNKVMLIQGFLRFARQNEIIEEIRPYLDKIYDSAMAIEHQIDFSKDYQNLGVKSPRWLNLSDMVLLTGNSAINIINDTGNVEIFADPLLEKVLYNLADNTVLHGETATRAHISVITDKGNVRIIWSDNGRGIPALEKELIFKKGFGKNTGLGLFLIREILAITGLTITETGEPGKGARFEILVPEGKWRYAREGN